MSIVDWFDKFYTRDNKNQTKYGTDILFEKYTKFSENNMNMRTFHIELKSLLNLSVIRRSNGYYVAGIIPNSSSTETSPKIIITTPICSYEDQSPVLSDLKSFQGIGMMDQKDKEIASLREELETQKNKMNKMDDLVNEMNKRLIGCETKKIKNENLRNLFKK